MSNIKAHRYKTEMCRNWERSGRCPYGPRCLFAHGYLDFRSSSRREAPNDVHHSSVPTEEKKKNPLFFVKPSFPADIPSSHFGRKEDEKKKEKKDKKDDDGLLCVPVSRSPAPLPVEPVESLPFGREPDQDDVHADDSALIVSVVRHVLEEDERNYFGHDSLVVREKKEEKEEKKEKKDELDSGVPDYICCPVTLDLFVDPVATELGHTYERRAIEDWMSSHDTDPMTGQLLVTKHLVPMPLVKSLCDAYRDSAAALAVKPGGGRSVRGVRGGRGGRGGRGRQGKQSSP